jgi:hypothetical protein
MRKAKLLVSKMEQDRRIEKILREYDRNGDGGKSYDEYFEEVYMEFFEPNLFDGTEEEYVENS